MKSSEAHLAEQKKLQARKRMAVEYLDLVGSLTLAREMLNEHTPTHLKTEGYWRDIQSIDITLTQAREFYFGPND